MLIGLNQSNPCSAGFENIIEKVAAVAIEAAGKDSETRLQRVLEGLRVITLIDEKAATSICFFPAPPVLADSEMNLGCVLTF